MTREAILAKLQEAASVVFSEGKAPDRLVDYWETLAVPDLLQCLTRWNYQALVGPKLSDPQRENHD